MASSTAVSYQFMPWLRRGLNSALVKTDTLGLGAALPAQATVPIAISLAGPQPATPIAPLEVRLHGPGEVTAIDQSLILRTDPRPNARNFEPNYLAIIDFDLPDLPWLLTPAQANGERLRPWLVLVVLQRAKTGLPKLAHGATLPVIRIAGTDVASELPDLAESWAWAHAQVVSAATDAAGLQTDLGVAASNASRLICPRRLEPNQDYVACVVPAFQPGRLRGLGTADSDPDGMAWLDPAWDRHAATDVELPVYYHWEFSTGPGGDFESLARRLRTPSAYKNNPAIHDLLEHVGTVDMGVDPLITAFAAGGTATMEGALVPLSYTPGTAPDPVQAQSLAVIVNTPEAQVVNPVADGPHNADGGRIEVKPPLVGAWHARRHQVATGKIGSDWLAGLNLSPRYRGAAGLGAEVVRQNQEHFVDAAWDQLGDILAAERAFNLNRLAIEGLNAMRRKRFDVLPPARLLQVMGPALARIEALAGDGSGYRIGGRVASLGGQIDRSSLPAALANAALRRSVAPTRRSLRLAARLTDGLKSLNLMADAYLGAMAAAEQIAAGFRVNDFVPDGILGSAVFDGADLSGPAEQPLDLGDTGFGTRFTVGQARQIREAARTAAERLAKGGVPTLPIRGAQHLGVFTDLHVERFGQLVTAAPGLRASDWSAIADTVEALGGHGVEGILVEADRLHASLTFSTLRIDARSGALHLDQAMVRTLDAEGRALAPAVARAQTAGTQIGTLRLGDARGFNAGALFAALPVNGLQGTVASTTALPRFEMGAGYELLGGTGTGTGTRATLTLPPALRKRAVLNRFSAATRGSRETWRDPYAVSRVEVKEVAFDLARAREIILLRTQPETTLRARLAASVSIAAAPGTTNPWAAPYLAADYSLTHQYYMVPTLQDRVMAWPRLPLPLYERLAKLDPYAFMPGMDGIPQDLVMLLRVNQHFIDSFMAGANHEMNGELLWRGFPTDLRGTPFQRFWDRKRVGPAPAHALSDLDDMEPMHLWGQQPLGKRSDPVAGDPNRVALLVRGQLLRRYPNALVYAWKKTPGADTLLKDAAGGHPDDAIQVPVFAGTVGEDISFFGFDIDDTDVPNWCFVLEEHMHEPRFGFDVEEPAPGAIRTGPPRRLALVGAMTQIEAANGNVIATTLPAGFNAYKALAWNHLGVSAGAHFGIGEVATVVNKPFPSFPTAGSVNSAAEFAKLLIQEPFRAYFVGSDLVT